MDDPNPELGGASEGAEDLELELEGEPKELGGDPLDDIQDPVARAEAKKWRAIARRKAEEKPEPKVEAAAPASTEYLTKADFYKANERRAIVAAQADPEVKANWDKIVGFYRDTRGKATTEDILEDIKDAVIIYNARYGKPEKDTSATELSATPVVKASGGEAPKVQPKPKDPPGYKPTSKPDSWYAKPN